MKVETRLFLHTRGYEVVERATWAAVKLPCGRCGGDPDRFWWNKTTGGRCPECMGALSIFVDPDDFVTREVRRIREQEREAEEKCRRELAKENAEKEALLADEGRRRARLAEIDRAIETQKKAHEAQKRQQRQHVGDIGERIELKVRVLRPKVIPGGVWGDKLLYRFRTLEQDELVWFTRSNVDIEPGWTTIRATVAEHEVYRGRRQTTLQRVVDVGRRGNEHDNARR